jgi:hypothetical protein
MPVNSGVHGLCIPYPIRIGRPVGCLSGAVRTVNAPRGAHHVPGLATCASRRHQRWGALLAVSRMTGLSSATSSQNRKGGAALLPCAEGQGTARRTVDENPPYARAE